MKAILIDDEPLALQYLEHQLLHIADVEIVGKYTDPAIGRRAVEDNEVDIVFLDIHIPEQNGIELAGLLLEEKPDLQVVFVTAHGEYAIDAFELNALDYVLKPVRKQRLTKTVERLRAVKKERPPSESGRADNLSMSMFRDAAISVGDRIVPLRWRTTKVHQLFLYLVQHRGQSVSKTAILELLWPELDTDKAYQQLYTAIYNIRKTLAPYESYFEIRSTSEGYRLRLHRVDLDVEQFERLLRSDIPLSEETVDKYEQAVKLYSGDYLQAYDYVWAEAERQRLQVQWVQAVLKLMEHYFHLGELDRAMALGLELCHRYPLEEEAHFFLMKIYASMGKRPAVQRQYEQLKMSLQKELQVQPVPEITAWYEHWKRSQME